MSFPSVIYASEGAEFSTGDSDRNVPIGTRMLYSGGDEYVWANVGGVILAVGRLNQSATQASPFGTDENPTASAAVGANTILVDVASALAVEDLKGGVLIDQTNQHSYTIVSNTVDDPTSIVITGPGLITDLIAADVVRFIKSPYKDIIIQPGPATATCVGFTVHIVAANEWGWVKTRGFTTVLVDGTLDLGGNVQASIDDAGGVDVATGQEQEVGVCYNIGSDGNANGEIYANISR